MVILTSQNDMLIYLNTQNQYVIHLQSPLHTQDYHEPKAFEVESNRNNEFTVQVN
jgi:hypothetical protein